MSKAVEEDLSFMLSSVKYDEDVTMNSEKCREVFQLDFVSMW
jgi:hypothetical protein